MDAVNIQRRLVQLSRRSDFESEESVLGNALAQMCYLALEAAKGQEWATLQILEYATSR